MSEEPDRLHSIGSQSRTQLKWLNMRAYILPSPQYFLSPDICQLQYTDEQLLASRLVSKLYDGNTLIGYVFLAFETPLPTSIPSTGQVFLRRLLLNKAVGESHSRKSIVSFHSSPYFQDSSLFQCLSHIYQWKFHPPTSSRILPFLSLLYSKCHSPELLPFVLWGPHVPFPNSSLHDSKRGSKYFIECYSFLNKAFFFFWLHQVLVEVLRVFHLHVWFFFF